MTVRPRLSADHRLLLTAALATEPALVAEAWSAWLARGNDLLTADAESLALMPLTGKNLARCGVVDAHSDRLKGLRRHGFVASTQMMAALAPVLQALGRTGVRALVTGGAALGQAVYGELGLRRTTDTAILVAPVDVPGAIRTLRSLGFAPSGLFPETLSAALRGQKNLAVQGFSAGVDWRNVAGFALGLHWSLTEGRGTYRQETAAFERAAALVMGGAPALVLGAADMLFQALERARHAPTPLAFADATIAARRVGPSEAAWAMIGEEVVRHFGDVGWATGALRQLRAIPGALDEVTFEAARAGLGAWHRSPEHGTRARGALGDRTLPEACAIAARSLVHRVAARTTDTPLERWLLPVWRRLGPRIP